MELERYIELLENDTNMNDDGYPVKLKDNNGHEFLFSFDPAPAGKKQRVALSLATFPHSDRQIRLLDDEVSFIMVNSGDPDDALSYKLTHDHEKHTIEIKLFDAPEYGAELISREELAGIVLSY